MQGEIKCFWGIHVWPNHVGLCILSPHPITILGMSESKQDVGFTNTKKIKQKKPNKFQTFQNISVLVMNSLKENNPSITTLIKMIFYMNTQYRNIVTTR